MTEEQLAKGRMALLKKQLADIEKQTNIKAHFQAVEDTSKYNLPYRVLLKQTYEEGEIKINRFYPFPGVPIENKWKWEDHYNSFEDWIKAISYDTGKTTPEEKKIMKIGVEYFPELKREIEAYEEKASIWNLDTEEGFTLWKKYFIRFLLPYKEDMKTWKAFDFFGTTEHTEAEAEQKRKYFLMLIAEYEQNPEAYDTEKHFIQEEDKDKYDMKGYIFLDEDIQI